MCTYLLFDLNLLPLGFMRTCAVFLILLPRPLCRFESTSLITGCGLLGPKNNDKESLYLSLPLFPFLSFCGTAYNLEFFLARLDSLLAYSISRIAAFSSSYNNDSHYNLLLLRLSFVNSIFSHKKDMFLTVFSVFIFLLSGSPSLSELQSK